MLAPLSRGEGIDLFVALGGEKPSPKDFAEMRAAIETWYKPLTDEGFAYLCKKITRKGWTRKQLDDALDRFTDRRYPNWTPGDLLGIEMPELHPYSWFQEMVDKDPSNGRAIRGYRIEGYDKPVYGWRHEVRDLLPVFVAEPGEPQPEEELLHENPITPEISSALKEFLSDVDVRELEKHDRKKRINELEKDLEQSETAVDELYKILCELLEGKLALEELRSRFQEQSETKEAA